MQAEGEKMEQNGQQTKQQMGCYTERMQPLRVDSNHEVLAEKQELVPAIHSVTSGVYSEWGG